MAFNPFSIGGPLNSPAPVVDTTDAFGLFDPNTADKGVEAMSRGTRKAARESEAKVLSGDQHRQRVVSTGMDEPGERDPLELNPRGHQAVDPSAATVPGGTMALSAPGIVVP